MSLFKVAGMALAGLIAITSAAATAAPNIARTAVPADEPIVEQVKKKKKKKKRDRAGKCGTYKYFDKKKKKCVDARR